MSEVQDPLLVQEYLLEKEREEREDCLPHLYGWKWYPWARRFFESTNKVNLLCAANQISKSSTQIRKCIHWATETNLWSELWRIKPNQFWYMYPGQKQVDMEFETKWSEFLPKGKMKSDPKYGWKEVKEDGHITGIVFNSGIRLYFKTYTQSVSALQTGTVFALFADEEMPMDLYDELIFRISASDGFFHMVFTATLGQDFWRRALEPKKNEEEALPTAFKQTVSLYDAMFYEDGSPSHWDLEKIENVKARCKNEDEVNKRVYGRFILIGGRKYSEFDASRHVKPAHKLPKEWLVYEGVDIGSGGEEGHPAAICFIAVRPDFRAGRIFAGWRGDGIVTDNSAIVRKHIEIKKEHNLIPIAQFYDWASKDFFIVAQGMGENFLPAEKSHDIGEDILNTLFKNDMLLVYEDEERELSKLVVELLTLKADENKRSAKDDFTDALRYSVTKVPWDFSWIIGNKKDREETPEQPKSFMQQQIDERRKAFDDSTEQGNADLNEEFAEWNELAGN